MSLKWKEIERVLQESRGLLEGAQVQKIAQSGDWAKGESFVFQGFHSIGGVWRLWASFFQEHTAFCLLPPNLKVDSAPEPSHFVMILRKHLLGLRIEKVKQQENDRLVFLEFEHGYTLLFILIPRRSNLILLHEGRCVGSYRQVSLEKGGIFTLPPSPQISKPDMREFGVVADGAYNVAVANHFWKVLADIEFINEQKVWRQAAKTQRKKILTALENTKKDLAESQEADLFQKRGLALTTKLYELGAKAYPKEKKILLSLIENGIEEFINVPLDPQKTYGENAEFFYKRSKKFTRASGELEKRVMEFEGAAARFEKLVASIESAESHADLRALTADAASLGINVAAFEELLSNTGGKDVKPREPKAFLELESSDGFLIYCGRNQEENRRVTFQECKGNDLWMHLRGLPGAHVVIRSQKNKTVPLQTLLEAAQVTLYYSKVRKGRKAEVDYTFRKYVRAIKGTVAEVTYTENKTLYIEPDMEILKKILAKSGV